MLVGIGTRVHARFHNALDDGLRVAKAREMPDGVEIHSRFACPLCGERGLNRIVNVIAVHEFVNTHALLPDRMQECSCVS